MDTLTITIGNTTTEVPDGTTWPEILVKCVNILRVEGYVIADEDIIHNLDSEIGEIDGGLTTAYAEGHTDCLEAINLDLSDSDGMRIVQRDGVYRAEVTATRHSHNGSGRYEVREDLEGDLLLDLEETT